MDKNIILGYLVIWNLDELINPDGRDYANEAEYISKQLHDSSPDEILKAIMGAFPQFDEKDIEEEGLDLLASEIFNRINLSSQVYIKPEENKAYWVKGEESGSVELW